MKNFYITTPIYYVNDIPHIGHAYTTLAADFIARFKRLDGYNVMFLTGTDEHGQKVAKAAQTADMKPQDFTDKVSQNFKHLNRAMNYSEDDFIRTTEDRHKQYVQKIWEQLVANGDIYLGKYAGWYSVRDEAFYAEAELIDGKAPTGAEVAWVEEESYFFRLSKYKEDLLKIYKENPNFIAPRSRLNEVTSFVEGNLEDLSISRTTFSWGVPVPGNSKHVIYVWVDALFNYISALQEKKEQYWPCDLHLMGKDIIRFHAVYWPALLMSAKLPLPKKIFAHGWWTNNGEKISKSLGNTINPLNLIEDFGLDMVRYFLMREVPFGNDGNYSRESFIHRVNSELANNIGNLCQRVLSFIQNNCDGRIVDDVIYDANANLLLEKARYTLQNMRKAIDAQELHNALGFIIQLSSSANEYVTLNPFWELNKTDKERMKAVLATLVQVLRTIAVLLQPIIPDTARKMLTQLGAVNDEHITFADIEEGQYSWNASLPKPEPLFAKLINS